MRGNTRGREPLCEWPYPTKSVKLRRTTVDVDDGGVDAEELAVGEGDDAEGLVDFVKVDVLGLDVGALQRLGDRQRGGSGEPDGLCTTQEGRGGAGGCAEERAMRVKNTRG